MKWLEKAKRAARYEPRHYPYINLGRLFAARGLVAKAIHEFEMALRLAPEEPGVAAALAALKQRIN
jgi:Tfp pilus assembly protein PilF